MVTGFTACELENKKPRKYSENLLNISRFNGYFIGISVFFMYGIHNKPSGNQQFLF